MGTAPGQRQQLSLPDPKRVVSRSLTIIQARGYGLAESLAVISFAAAAAADVLRKAGIDDTDWLASIDAEAARRARFLNPSTTDTKG